MGYDKGLAERLRKAGLVVKETSGWQSRGNEYFYPKGAVTHHTAGPPPSAGRSTPSLSICIFGRSDLPGPLCNTYLGYDNVVYVVAAGRANHAGIPDGGSCRGMTGNTTAWGLEVEHPGTFPLAPERAEIAARIQAATIKGTTDESMVVYHKEWAPSRKPDLATAPSPSEHRARVAFYLKGGKSEGGEEVEVPAWFWDWSNWYLNTDRDPKKRPANAPDAIPKWAWDYQEEVQSIARNHGMTEGERDWISWLADGKKGERPPVPQTIPERWWPDNEYVVGASK